MLRELTALFESLLYEMPAGTAALNVYGVPRGGGTVIELKPANAAAARFGVHCDESDLFSFSFGRVSGWEWPYERRYRNNEKDTLAEIEEMSRAVIAGKCEETRRWFSRTGRIFVEGYTYEMTDLPKVPRPPFGTTRYAPYVQGRSTQLCN
jgi:hypothetical protein